MKKNRFCSYLLLLRPATAFTFLLFTLAVTVSSQTMPPGADARVWQRALQIHRKAIVVDTHNDITTPMYDEDFDLGTSSTGKFHVGGDPFHTDIARMKAGGLNAEFF